MIRKLHSATTRRRLFHSICALGCIVGTVAWNSGAFLVALAVAAAPEALIVARRGLRGRFRSRAALRQSLRVRSAGELT
jgi:hypothetical protein